VQIISVVISRPWSRDSSALEFILSRSRSRYRDLKSWSQDSTLGAYACSTITVICSTFKRVLCHQFNAASVVISRPWSRDSSALEFILSRSRSRSRELVAKVSRPKKGLDNNTADHVYCSVTKTYASKMVSRVLNVSDRINCHSKYKVHIFKIFFKISSSLQDFILSTWLQVFNITVYCS